MNEGKQNPKGPSEMPSVGLKLGDIYYIVFRQKWWILACLIAGTITAGIMYTSQKPMYSSEAKLLLRYVVENKAAEAGVGAQTRSVGGAAESIISSEFQILTSLDLCEEVAVAVGPDRILGPGGSNNIMGAAMVIRDGLSVDNPPRSSIIVVRFTHADPTICPDVLRQLIESYLLRHKAVHRDPREFDEVLFEHGQKLLASIRQNEDKLRRLKSDAGIVSVEEARKSLSEQSTKLRQELFGTLAQLAEYKTILGTQKDESLQQKEAAKTAPSREKVTEYTSLRARIDSLRNREFDLLLNFTEENPQVVRLREQIAINEKRQKALEAEYPKLPALYFGATTASNTQLDPNRIPALESRLEAITNQLAQVRTNITELDALDSVITDIQRTLELDLVSYRHVTASFEAARFDEALSTVKSSNIQYVQKPSPSSMNVIQRAKRVGGAFVGFLLAGLGIAFLIEMFVDHSVRRPADLETKLKIPLFMSIPKLNFNGHAKMLPFPARALATVGGDGDDDLKKTWADEHPLRAYIDGLRDSTLTFFGGDPHKPKLIGVTGCKDGSGVTSLAAGLAGALSETGDGNVLLLNLNLDGQAVHPFYRGELACNLTEALESDKRQNGMVLQNLYVATAGNPTDPAATNLSKQLARVVPQLRVSDYDYIVFDLPPTTPTTMTARLAGMMDLVILVVESEKDSQDTVKQAARLLARSQAKVSAVLNKVRNPVPRWLHKGA